MRDLIRKILKEDLDWVKDVDDKQALERFDYLEVAAEVFSGKEVEYDMSGDVEGYRELSDEEIKDKSELLEWYLTDNYFSDIEVRGGRYYMSVNHWEDFTDMFEDCRGGYNYMCRHLAKAVLAEDEYWEPYYDITQDWYNEVWTLVNKETYDEIIKHIQEKYVGDSMSGNMTIHLDGDEVELTQELLDSWIGDSDVLGHIINDVPEFEDLKNSLEHSYESAYNMSARDNVYKAATNAITDLFGEGKWESYEVKKMDGTETRYHLLFDVTNIFWDVISTYYNDYCDLDYDRSCEFEYSDFFSLCKFLMYEDIWEDELNPSFNEYPNDDDIYMYFNDEASERLYW